MPRIPRWFPVSHDINADAEVWLMRHTIGEKSLSIWLEILSISDRNESELPGDYDELVRSIAGRCQASVRTVSSVFQFAKIHFWLVSEPTLKVCNYAKYHRTREPNKIPTGGLIGSPPNLPDLPDLPDLPRKNKKEEDILSSSCAEISNFARAEGRQNGRPLAKKKNYQGQVQALDLATKLKDSILANTPDARVPTDAQVKEWAGDIDKLNRLDEKSWEQIEWLLAWSQKDPFWSKNIQSGGKFRKQWNQLLAKAKAERPRHGRPLTEEELAEEDDFARLTREELERKAKAHGQHTL